jgi:hypothetical protein
VASQTIESATSSGYAAERVGCDEVLMHLGFSVTMSAISVH